MTRCLLRGFDSNDRTGDGQVSCELRELPGRRTLPLSNPFQRQTTQCTDLTGASMKTYPSCDIVGRTNRTMALNGTHDRSGAGGNIWRKDSAPPFRGADDVSGLIHDAQAGGFRFAAKAHYERKLDDRTRSADAARELVGNTAKSGLDPAASLIRMEEMGVKAATLDPSIRAHFLLGSCRNPPSLPSMLLWVLASCWLRHCSLTAHVRPQPPGCL